MVDPKVPRLFSITSLLLFGQRKYKLLSHPNDISAATGGISSRKVVPSGIWGWSRTNNWRRMKTLLYHWVTQIFGAGDGTRTRTPLRAPVSQTGLSTVPTLPHRQDTQILAGFAVQFYVCRICCKCLCSWWARWDSNPHGFFSHQLLRLARLPFHHSPIIRRLLSRGANWR